GLRVHEEPSPPGNAPAVRRLGFADGTGGAPLMPRIFGHYVPSPLLFLIGCEAATVFGSVFIGLALPLVGIPAVRPAWSSAVPPAVVLTMLLLATIHVAGLYDMR